jgi:hypothetical protein
MRPLDTLDALLIFGALVVALVAMSCLDATLGGLP